MFDPHAIACSKYARRSPDCLFRVLQFVIITVRQPIGHAPNLMRIVDRQGEHAKCLWGWKGRAWREASEARAAIYSDTMELDAIADPDVRERELLTYYARLYGFGLVKGGFVAQLAFNCGGCLDTHNMERFNLRRGDVRADGASFKDTRPATRARKVETYLDICHALGGTAALWDGWCTYVADREPARYGTADRVSEIHCEALGA